MSNDFYNHATYPAPNSAGSSAAMRAELELIKAGFDKMPTLTGNGYKLVGVNAAGTALEADADLMNVDFSTSNTASGAVGRLTWNDTDGTLDLGLKGGNVTLQIGQEQVVRVYNETASGFTDMQVVRITGAAGNRLTAQLAQADSESGSASTFAIMTEACAASAQGFATTFGLVRALDTSAFTEGATLYLSTSTAGGITTTRPSAPNHTVILGWCVRSHATQGSIYVNINNGYELEELHDVLITSVAANNMLRRNSANTVWENIAGPSGAVVGTTDTQTLTNKTISGGTVNGAAVTGLSSPTNSGDAATKGYTDTGLALKLNLAGGTMSGAIAMGTNKITGLGNPTADQDAATKVYVDNAVQGLDAKASVRVATTANITLSGTQTIDDIALSAGERVLVKDQSTAANNGIYLVAAGSWTRTTDADAWTELVSAFVFVEAGTTNGNNGYTCTVAAGGTLGSTAITWVQFSGAGQITAGAGLTKTGNTLNVGTASSARIVVNADNLDLATIGTAGNYGLVTVDAYGRVTAGSLPTTIAGFGITNAYTKTEVDTALALKLNLTGGTLSGNLAMGGNKVTGLGAPTTDNDAVRLIYVTTLFGSTSSAAASAAAALVSENAAAASQSAAATSEGNALTYKNAAATSATNAATSETNAASSASAAAASYDSFDDRYLGPKSTAPAVDNDGNALLVGALYFDTTINSMRVYDGSLWMSAGSSVNGTSRRYKYVATAAQTTFTGVDANGATLAYDPLYLDVYLNGSRLDASDYTATSGSSIVLGVAASANDELNIVCFGTFAVATHVLKTGDTMTGQLTVPNLVSTNGSTIQGLTVGKGAGSVATNTAVGYSVLSANTTGLQNSAFGFEAAKLNTTGSWNSAFGLTSLAANTTGNYNQAIGYSSLTSNTTGSSNTAVGGLALASNTTASNNTAIGYQAAYTNTTGSRVNAFGYKAAYLNTTGAGLVAIGNSALESNTTGQSNVAVGSTYNANPALYANTTGSYNTAVGEGSLAGNTTASNNTAVGYTALYSTTTGNSLAGFGSGALYSNTTGTDNTAIGRNALYYNTTGLYNTAVGVSALVNNTTASNNTAIGYQAGYSYTGTGGRTTMIGYQAGLNMTTGGYNTAIGSGAMLGLGGTITGTDNIAIGSWHDGVLEGPMAYLSSGSQNIAIGQAALKGSGINSLTGSYNVALGNAALASNTTSSGNVAVGYQAALFNTTGAGLQAVGYQALFSNTTGSYNTAIGEQALYSTTTAINNTAVGHRAGYGITTGQYNTAVGRDALGSYGTKTGSFNTAIGFEAGKSLTTGGFNLFVGGDAGAQVTTGNGNTFVGTNNNNSACGYLVTTGSNNTILGGYDGNQAGLDIRTSSNWIVLSDGLGTPRMYHSGPSGTLFIPDAYNYTTGAGANAYIASNGFLGRSTSALKYKQDIRDLEEMDIGLLRPVRYKSKCANDDQTKDHLGLIADEAAEAGFEELISRGADGDVEGFQYERLTVVLLKKLQTLDAEFKAYVASHP